MTIKSRWLASVADVKVGYDGIVGARLRPALALIPLADVNGQALLNRFLTTSERALRVGSDGAAAEASAHAARALYDWSETHLQGAARNAFRQELLQRWKPVMYAGEALHVRLPRLPELALDAAPAVRRVEGLLRLELSALHGSAAPQGQLAATTLQRMQALIGPGQGGWGELAALCHRNRVRMADDARSLRALRQQVDALPPGTAARRALETRMTREFSGLRWAVRGLLGELYLRHWPRWQHELAELMADANRIARHGLGAGWHAERFAGRIRIDGLEAWDEAVLLLNRSDRQAALHTCAQIKVENVVSAFKQMANDAARQTGRKVTPPTIQLFEDGRWVTYAHRPLPPGVDSYRYVFFAGGGRIRESHLWQLERAQLSARAFELDLSLQGFDALALEVMAAVERMAPLL